MPEPADSTTSLPSVEDFGAMPHYKRNLYRKLWEGKHTFPSDDELPLPHELVTTKASRLVPLLVYFVQEEGGGAIKIGVAVNPAQRLCNLQIGNPRRLKVVALTHGGVNQESRYHYQFRDHRIGGEWFEPHPDIMAEIERLGMMDGVNSLLVPVVVFQRLLGLSRRNCARFPSMVYEFSRNGSGE